MQNLGVNLTKKCKTVHWKLENIAEVEEGLHKWNNIQHSQIRLIIK
jgi:hypothetical protein